jgi:hypothetical protein
MGDDLRVMSEMVNSMPDQCMHRAREGDIRQLGKAAHDRKKGAAETAL